MSESQREKSAPTSEDVALLCGRSEDGKAVHVIRRRNDRLEAGVVQPLEQGKPIHGEVVTLSPRKGAPLLCDVEVHHDARAALPASSGTEAPIRKPARVASQAYRNNWDAIWSARRTRDPRPN